MVLIWLQGENYGQVSSSHGALDVENLVSPAKSTLRLFMDGEDVYLVQLGHPLTDDRQTATCSRCNILLLRGLDVHIYLLQISRTKALAQTRGTRIR
jgi:hypothetical protein